MLIKEYVEKNGEWLEELSTKEGRSIPNNEIGHEDVASSSEVFVTADEFENTDWDAQLNGLGQIVAKNRK